MKITLPDWLVTRIILRAQATPYFHLTQADGSPYMDRWWLLPKWLLRLDPERSDGAYKPVAWLPFGIRLHHIASSDNDRHLHDHPFRYWTWIIRHGYWEITPVALDPRFEGERESINYTWHPEGKILSRRATDRHAIKVSGAGAWTIFVQFRKTQPWGFYTPRGKVYWWNYSITRTSIARRVMAIRGGHQ